MATYNGAATLPKVLDAYCRLIAPRSGWRVVVADNGSTDGTRALLATYADRLPLCVVSEPRRGKNVALNAALLCALSGDDQAGLFVFTDDDATPDRDWLLRLEEAAWTQPDYDIFGGAIAPDWATEPPAWLVRLVPLGLTFGITPPDTPEGPVFAGLVWGANMAIRRALFAQGLRFDEAIGPTAGAYAMGSETQLTRHLADIGHRAWFCPGARVAHHIRAAQMTREWVLERAFRFGRGKFRQECPGRFPEWFGVPRWMYARYAREALGLAGAWLHRDADGRFQRRWELAYLRGHFHEAWRGTKAVGKRRVLITSYSGELGGMELRMAQEARFLRAGGYDSMLGIRAFPRSEEWAEELRARRVPVTRFDPPPVLEDWQWRRVNKWRALLWGRPALRRHRADLVHVAFCWNTYGATALWLAGRCGLPAVVSVHNTFPPCEFGAWHHRLLREAFATVRGIYGATESALQHFLVLYKPYLRADVRLAVIPNCVDTARFQPSPAMRSAARERWGVPSDALVIGSVARLSPQKRPEALVTLLHALRPRFPNLFLVLAGAGPLEAAVRRHAAALGVERYVIFAGYQQRVEELIPAFDLHLLLSRREGFGIATIEALACGVPAVASDVPGNADVLAGCAGGELVPLDDEAAVAGTVAALLADPVRRERMGKEGREDVVRRFAATHVQALVHEFYRGLV
ncbi:glycosyltransferase involved in cell wall biosynthesis [Pseudoduganella flava]|uniref:Glycosyltransferase n=2 Tax=Pseudoduganella flava TaxID=871742 RepID=A0A562PR38_9BURK|nr:glycosyltransferase [Pseudoduganella flava]TWI46630.1 glycosyltransferase involved in cell wall biosynthesis [Pseudoduganella flava]